MLPPLFERGIKSVILEQPGFVYQGAYHDLNCLKQALVASDSQVDLLIMDYHEAFDNYPQLLSGLRQANDRLRILFMLPPVFEESVLVHALRSGGDGYLLQSVSEDVLLDAIREITTGRGYIDSQMTPAVLEELRKPAYALREWDTDVVLTERERHLIQLAADGLNNVQIGQVLGLAEKTVRNMWSSLFDKIGYKDRTQAVLWAIRTGQAELR
jgi:two-component system response regulator DegU